MKRLSRLIVEAFRAEFGGRHRSGSRQLSSRRAPTRRRPPTNPRCDGCQRFVSGLCEKGCGFCPGCCPGHKKEDQR